MKPAWHTFSSALAARSLRPKYLVVVTSSDFSNEKNPELAVDALEQPDGPAAEAEEKSAMLDEFSDRLAAFRALTRGDDPEATDRILGEFGARGTVERDIVREISARKPLWMPDRFEEAHRLVMRSLEVLDRNGARSVKPKLGPLSPVAAFLVQLVTRFIVRNYQAEVITQIKNLYVRREANSAPNIPERFMLRRARIDAERMMPTLKKNPLGANDILFRIIETKFVKHQKAPRRPYSWGFFISLVN